MQRGNLLKRGNRSLVLVSLFMAALVLLTGCAPRATSGETAAAADESDVVVDLPALVLDVTPEGGITVGGQPLTELGGGLGASLRHLINVTCARTLGTGFPWGTFIINITGSTVMGLIAGYLAFKGEASQPWRLFLITGILGGYTTFSAYSLDAALLYERGELASAALYVVGSVALSIAGLFAGLALVRQFT